MTVPEIPNPRLHLNGRKSGSGRESEKLVDLQDFRVAVVWLHWRHERQRVEQDSGMAGLPGISKRDQRIGQDVAFMGTAQAWEPQAGVLRLRQAGS